MIELATLSLLLLLGAGALWATGIIARRMWHDSGRLRLAEVLRAKGLGLQPEGEAEMLKAAHAVRRCAGCAAHERCDTLIAAADWKGLRAICPNTSYIDERRA